MIKILTLLHDDDDGIQFCCIATSHTPFHKAISNFKCGKGAHFLEGGVGETGSRWKTSTDISRASPTWLRCSLKGDIARRMEEFCREQGSSNSVGGGQKGSFIFSLTSYAYANADK